MGRDVSTSSTGGHRIESSTVSQHTEQLSKALHYFEEKGLRRVLHSLTEALLVDQPENPVAYMVDALSRVAISSGSAVAGSKAAAPSSHNVSGIADVDAQATSRQDKGPACIAGTTGVVRAFLEAKCAGPEKAVQCLMEAAVSAYGGAAYFYSAPGGRGRGVVVRGESAERRAGFVLVMSTQQVSEPGDLAPAEDALLMRQALEQGVASTNRIAAGVVRTTAGLEGVLLLRLPEPVHRPQTYENLDGSTNGGLAVLPAMREWCLALTERLENIHWRGEAASAAEAFGNTLNALERLSTRGKMSTDLVTEISGVTSQALLRGGIMLDRVSLWHYAAESNEMVSNNSGQLDGFRAAVNKSIVGDATAHGGRDIICVLDVYSDSRFNRAADEKTGFRTQSTICVPIKTPQKEGFATDGLSVVQFINGRKAKDAGTGMTTRCFNHFDLVRAEALEHSVLPTALQMRGCLLNVLEEKRQSEGLKNVITLLDGTSTVNEVMKVVQDHVPMVLDCELATVFFYDEQQYELWAPRTELLPEGYSTCVGDDGEYTGMLASGFLDAADSNCCVKVSGNPRNSPCWQGTDVHGVRPYILMTAPVYSTGHRMLGMIQLMKRRIAEDTGADTYSMSGEDLSGGGIVQGDLDLVVMLANALGVQLQRLLLDMVWTKVRMEHENLTEDSMLQEYYEQPRVAKRETVVVKSNNSICGNLFQNLDIRGATEEPDDGRPTSAGGRPISASQTYLTDLAPPSALGSAERRANVQEWRVDYWSIADEDALHFVNQALRYSDVFSEIQVRTGSFVNFVLAVKESYRPTNQYHNFQHALSTMHYAFKLLHHAQLSKILGAIDKFALIIGAICHDCDHRGVNNAFEVITQSELAILYNDRSPLENHHCAVAFSIAFGKQAKSQCNIFKNLPTQVYTGVRRQMIAGILATDMSHHGDHVKILQSFQLEEHCDQSQFLVEVLMHTADVGNPMMPTDIAARWGRAVCQEFTAQVAQEERLGLPVTTFMVGLTDEKAQAKSQLGFIDFVVQPLASAFFRAFPDIEEPKLFLEENREATVLLLDDVATQKSERRKTRELQRKRTLQMHRQSLGKSLPKESKTDLVCKRESIQEEQA